VDTTDAVKNLYADLLRTWNSTDAAGFASAFHHDGEVIGFDGSVLNGRDVIEAEMARIFADHRTGTYVGIVHEVVALSPDVAVARAVAGVVPAGADDLAPALNSVQRRDGQWRIALYHNTPAQFHGRPELVERLTADLRQARAAAL
jgi:uncharacterized protein (TIGR02246 family)